MFAIILPFLLALPPIVYGLFSLYCGRSFFRGLKEGERCPLFTHQGYFPPVSIIKPVKGIDAGSLENFSSFCRQEYPDFQIIFACASGDDPAVEIIRQLQKYFPAREIDLVIDDRIHGPNYKVCNLINAYDKARHDIIIICDSDIRVGSAYLQKVCGCFTDPAVGLVTSLYRSTGVSGAAAALEAMGFTCEMIPNVMAALRLEGLSFALGASMAVRRDALEKIGGFHALVDYLADDYQLGNRIYLAGYRIELSGYFVESITHRENLGTILSRQLRWARTMRVSRPGGYFASVITQPFPFAVVALAFSGFSSAGFGAASLIYIFRFLVAVIYSRSFIKDHVFPRWLWLLPVRDALSFLIWGASFLGNRVRWRGHLFRLLPGGKIKKVGSAKPPEKPLKIE